MPVVFFAFRIMVGIGLALLATAITGAVLRWRGGLTDTRWFLWLTMATGPLGFVAVLAGWTTTEAGRQPFVVYGALRTADAASPLASGAVASTFAAFTLIYAILLAAFLWFAVRIALAGPVTAGPQKKERHPGLARTGTSLTAGVPSATPAPGE